MPEVDTREEVVETPLSQGYRNDAQQVTVEYHKPGTARPDSEEEIERQKAIQESLDEDNVADTGDRPYAPLIVTSPDVAYATKDNIVVPNGAEAPAVAEAAAETLNQVVEVAVNPGDRQNPVVAVPADGTYRPDLEEQVEASDVDAGATLDSAEPNDPDSEDEDREPQDSAE